MSSNPLKRYWIDFAAWVKGRNSRLQIQTVQPILVQSWAGRKLAYAHAQKAHHGQRVAYAHLRRGTHEALMRDVLNKEDAALIALIETRPWLFSRGDSFEAAIKAIARKRVAEAQR
jgi:hypothetical protein